MCDTLQMPVDYATKKPKGIAFFDFDSPEAAAKAIAVVSNAS